MKKTILLSVVSLFVLSMALPVLAEGPKDKGELKLKERERVMATTTTGTPKYQPEKFVRRSANLTGTVIAMSGNVLPANITIKLERVSPKKNSKWAGTYPEEGKEVVILVDSGTKFVRKYWNKSNLGEMTLGDKLDVKIKTNSDGTVTASYIRNESLSWSLRAHNGTIANLDITNKTFTLNQRNGQVVNVKMDDKTKVFVSSSTTTSLADLKNDQLAHVRGLYNSRSKMITAGVIRVSLPKLENTTTTISTTTTQQ